MKKRLKTFDSSALRDALRVVVIVENVLCIKGFLFQIQGEEEKNWISMDVAFLIADTRKWDSFQKQNEMK